MSFVLTHSAMRMPAIVLVMLCGGCGAPVPDESARLQSPPMVSTSQAEKASTPHSLAVGDTAMPEKRIEGKSSEMTLVNPSEDPRPAPISSIPYSVVKDLAAPEAGTRLRALEHWEQKESNIPLDAVFEAMEDEDETVRARATAIVEERWAAEQEKERG